MSGLQAFRQALDVTGQNIANANTDGYVRQRAELVARESTPVGASWVGNGVEVSRLARVVDDFLADQSRVSQSNSARLEVFAGQAARVSNLLGDPSGGLSNALQRLNNALEAVATEPGSMAARQGLVETLDSTVSQIRGLDSRLRDLDGATHSRIVAEAATVDGLVGNLATLNRDLGIARATIIGHSMGGMLAARFATQYPDVAERVVIGDDQFQAEFAGPPCLGDTGDAAVDGDDEVRSLLGQ